jgi:hypothetical protein
LAPVTSTTLPFIECSDLTGHQIPLPTKRYVDPETIAAHDVTVFRDRHLIGQWPHNLNTVPSTEMNLCELTERWEAVQVTTLKASTADHYRNALRAYVVPSFGKWQVNQIGRYDVERFLAEQAKKYSKNTLRSMSAALGVLLSWAVSCEWISKNPCSGVKLPRGEKKVVRTVLKPEEVAAIAGELEEPYDTLVLFLATTGLRIGEAVAVQWEDFNGNLLSVKRRIYKGDVDTGEDRTPGAEPTDSRGAALTNETARQRGMGVPFAGGNSGQSGKCFEAVCSPGCEEAWNQNWRLARLPAQGDYHHATERGASEGDLWDSW